MVNTRTTATYVEALADADLETRATTVIAEAMATNPADSRVTAFYVEAMSLEFPPRSRGHGRRSTLSFQRTQGP